MKPNKQAKIQQLVISHLKDHGTLDIVLPDGIILEIGITQTNKRGEHIKSDDYCYVMAQRDDKKTMLDSYNLGISFGEEDDNIVFEESGWDEHGTPIRRLDVI